jgi:hypothetical protein
LLFDSFAGGLVCGIFLGVRESRTSDTAQGERRQIANNGMDEIHVGLPFFGSFYFTRPPAAVPDRAGCAGSLGGFYEKELWMLL